jgi:TPP-dependent pyruvate/acetoin dehydrogenase alpha subunit
LSNGETTSSDLESIAQEVKVEMEEAVDFAEDAPFPLPEEVSQHVYPS